MSKLLETVKEYLSLSPIGVSHTVFSISLDFIFKRHEKVISKSLNNLSEISSAVGNYKRASKPLIIELADHNRLQQDQPVMKCDQKLVGSNMALAWQ